MNGTSCIISAINFLSLQDPWQQKNLHDNNNTTPTDDQEKALEVCARFLGTRLRRVHV